MNTQMKELVRICQLLVIFSTLTLLFYGAIVWIGNQIEQNYRYEQPKGKAVKVFDPLQEHHSMTTLQQVKNRLLFYYWYGE